MKSKKTKDQAQSGTEQSKIPAPDLAQQIYPTATVGRGANQPADPSAAITIDKIDKFSENTEQIKECEKLYISSDILLTAKQVKIFKDNNIEVFIIPEYYFDEEIKGVQ